MQLRRIARDNSIALGFGFYENNKGGIYNSYLIIGKEGEDYSEFIITVAPNQVKLNFACFLKVI